MAHIPLRMCVVCRTRRPAQELIRVVADKELHELRADSIDKKTQVRGAYICRSTECIKRAEKKRVLERHLNCGASESFYRQAEDMI